MNSCQFIGRLTRPPKTNTITSTGKLYTKFALAVNRPGTSDADFINCVAFGKVAELVDEYVTQGLRIGVTGSLRQSNYEVKGEKRTSYELLVAHVTFVDYKEGHTNKETTTNPTNNGGAAIEDEDEFPF